MERKSTTIRLRKDLIDRLDQEAEERDVSRSEYLRQIIRDRQAKNALADEVERLRERIDAREQRVQELERQLARRSKIEERVEEVALEVREEREQRNAPFFIRWYQWWKNRE